MSFKKEIRFRKRTLFRDTPMIQFKTPQAGAFHFNTLWFFQVINKIITDMMICYLYIKTVGIVSLFKAIVLLRYLTGNSLFVDLEDGDCFSGKFFISQVHGIFTARSSFLVPFSKSIMHKMALFIMQQWKLHNTLGNSCHFRFSSVKI